MLRKRSLLQSQKLRRRRHHIFIAKIVGGVVVFALAVFGVTKLSSLSSITIHTVLVEGASAIDAKTVEASVLSSLSGKYFGLLDKNNVFLFPKKEIMASLGSHFPRAAKISIDTTNLQTLKVTIDERKPMAVWCGTEYSATTSPCYLFDSGGFIFDTAPQFSGSLYVRYFGALTHIATSSPIIGSSYLLANRLPPILAFVGSLNNLQLKPDRVEVDSKHHYNVTLESGATIFIDEDFAADVLTANLTLLLQQKVFLASQKKGFSDISYIDLRLGNKIFYKFKSGVVSSNSLITATSTINTIFH